MKQATETTKKVWRTVVMIIGLLGVTSILWTNTAWTWMLEGQVKDEVTGQVIPSATVKIDNWGTTTTDINGNYKFTINIAADYVLTVSKTDYETRSVKISVSGNKSQIIYLKKLFTGWVLQGKIKNLDTGQPISSATVKIDNWGTTITDINGNYKFSITIAAEYTLTASKTGYQTSTVKVNVNSDKTQDISLPLTEITYKLEGYVKNTNTGAKIESAVIKIDGLGVTSTTNSNGYYQFILKNTGGYTLITTKSGYQTNFVKVIVNANQWLDISLSPSSGSGYKVEGLVKDAITGEKLVEATVKIDDWGTTATDNNGYYQFTIKTLTYYTFAASKTDYNSNIIKLNVNGNKWLDIPLTYAFKYKIEGYVKDDTGNNIGGAVVKLDNGTQTTTNNTGYYRIGINTAGSYKLTVLKSGYNAITITLNVDVNKLQNITITPVQAPVINTWSVSSPNTFLGKRRAFATTFRMDDKEDPQLQQYGGGHVCASGLRIPPGSTIRACALSMPNMYDTSNTKVIPMTWGDCTGSDIPAIKWQTQVKITYVKTGQSVIASLEDGGPAKSAREHELYKPYGAWIDVTPQVKKDFNVDPLENTVVDFEVLNDQFNPINLVFLKPVTVSSYYKQSVNNIYSADGVQGMPYEAVDGNHYTYWQAGDSNLYQDLTLDLETAQSINTISVLWGSSYATKYNLLLSADGTNWKKIPVTTADGNWDCYGFNAESVRYIKLETFNRNQTWGIQIIEFVVQNRTTQGNTSLGNNSFTESASSLDVSTTKPKQRILTPNGDGTNDQARFAGLNTFRSMLRAQGFYDTGNANENAIEIYDMSGKLVRTVVDEESWDGKDDQGNKVESGIYIYHYQLAGKVVNGTIVIAK